MTRGALPGPETGDAGATAEAADGVEDRLVEFLRAGSSIASLSELRGAGVIGQIHLGKYRWRFPTDPGAARLCPGEPPGRRRLTAWASGGMADAPALGAGAA